jgi:hypothetical protein
MGSLTQEQIMNFRRTNMAVYGALRKVFFVDHPSLLKLSPFQGQSL